MEDVTDQMEHETWQAEQFEALRPKLQSVAYRMLGSTGEAEDAVQEAWLRLSRSDDDAIENLGGWLTTVVARISLDMLRTRRARREDTAGDHLPEPIVTAGDSPEDQALLADSVGIALLIVLDTLTPAERLAFVLHDMFDVPFEEIAPIVDRTPTAARKLASRARQRVRGAAPDPEPDIARQREVVDAFLAASRAGDFEGLVAVLDPDVVFRLDLAPAGFREVHGAGDVARTVLARGSRFAPHARPAIVNGMAGVIVDAAGRHNVVAFNVVDGRIRSIDLISVIT
jgi:RNA polymerase sigma-70 factor (ECF subfamily)